MHSTSLLSTTAFILVVLVSLSKGAIISQSSISDCSWGDDSEPTAPGGVTCQKKMLISMVLGSAQGNTESLHANIDRAHEEGRDEMSILKKPFRIELRKTAVVVSYRAYLVGTANALPKETSIKKKHCVDDFYANPKKLPCGMQYDNMQRRVWDSQGFCCTCGSFEASYNKRGGHSCDLGNIIQSRGSAHCMKMDDLWYDIFTLEMPMMQYKITLDVLELQDITVDNKTKTQTVNWTPISTFHLSPSKTIGRSKTGRVIAEIQGSLLGSKSIKDLSTKMLLVPSVRMWPKDKPYPAAYTNGPNDWMLVDKSMVQLLGTECNKVGVQYTGFRRQHGRCQTEAGFCFHNQPLQLWRFDHEQRKEKKSGRYMIHNYGTVHQDSHPNNDSFILKFLHDDLHNSFVTLRIDATDISFVKSVSSGRIVETYTVPFTATVGHGTLTVEVGNTGEVSSDYSVSVVKCDSGLYDMAARSLSLEPGEVKNTTFALRSGDIDGGGKECEVQLYDSTFNLIDAARVNIKVGAACLCFGICGCVCEDEEMGTMDCSKPGPPTVYKPGPIALTLFVMLLESIGAHGFIGFFGGLLLILGFIKLSFGGLICCRKTKAQKHTQKLIEKGVPPKSPLLVQCSGECRGAKAAIARYQRKVNRLKAAGKSPHRLDDWRNTSFECHCKSELADVQMIHVVRTVCFFYFCCILPFIWIGRCLVWRIFRDTEANKVKAEQEVLKRAKEKGNLEKYGVIDLAIELKKFEEKTEGSKKKENEEKEEKNDETEKLEEEKKEDKEAVSQPLFTDTPTESNQKKDKPAKTELTKAKKDSKNKKGSSKDEKAKKNKQSKTKHQNKQSTNLTRDEFGYDEQSERETNRKQQRNFKDQQYDDRLDTKRQTPSPRQKVKPSRDTRGYSPQIKQSPHTKKREVAQRERGANTGEKQCRDSKQKGDKGEKSAAKESGQVKKSKIGASSMPESQPADKEDPISHGGNDPTHPPGSQTSQAALKSDSSLHDNSNSGENTISPSLHQNSGSENAGVDRLKNSGSKCDSVHSIITSHHSSIHSGPHSEHETPHISHTISSQSQNSGPTHALSHASFSGPSQSGTSHISHSSSSTQALHSSRPVHAPSNVSFSRSDLLNPSQSGSSHSSHSSSSSQSSHSSGATPSHATSFSGSDLLNPSRSGSSPFSQSSHRSGPTPSHATSFSRADLLNPSQSGSSHSSHSSSSSQSLHSSGAVPSHATSFSGADLLNPSRSGSSPFSQSSHSSGPTLSHATSFSGADLLNPSQSGSNSSHISHSTLSIHSSHHTSSSHDTTSGRTSHSTDTSSKSTSSSSSGSSSSDSSHSDSTTAVTSHHSESSSHLSSSTNQPSHSDDDSSDDDNDSNSNSNTSSSSSSDDSGSETQSTFESEQSSHSTTYVRDSGSRSLSG